MRRKEDRSSNIYTVVPDNPNADPGDTDAFNKISVQRGKKDDDQTGAHEIGHTLGIAPDNRHPCCGLMNGGNDGQTTIYPSDIQDIMSFAVATVQQYPLATHFSINGNNGNIPKGKVKRNKNQSNNSNTQ